MKTLTLFGGAALMAISASAMAQSTTPEPAPDAATTAPAPMETTQPTAGPAAPAAAEGAPAVAQSTTPAADAVTTTPAANAEASAAATPTAPAAASADASAKVNADWAKYDVGNKGKLTPLEFGSWVLAKNGQDVTAQVEKTKTSKKANLPAIKVLNATSAEFAKADKDKDRMISPDELAGYLSA